MYTKQTYPIGYIVDKDGYIRHDGPEFDAFIKSTSSALERASMPTILYPETSLTEEFFEDNLSIPDQLRFRDDTLVKAVAALEAKADSDEPRIIGAQRLMEEKAKDIPDEVRMIEEALWELEMLLDFMVSWKAIINHKIGNLKEILSVSGKSTPV